MGRGSSGRGEKTYFDLCRETKWGRDKFWLRIMGGWGVVGVSLLTADWGWAQGLGGGGGKTIFSPPAPIDLSVLAVLTLVSLIPYITTHSVRTVVSVQDWSSLIPLDPEYRRYSSVCQVTSVDSSLGKVREMRSKRKNCSILFAYYSLFLLLSFQEETPLGRFRCSQERMWNSIAERSPTPKRNCSTFAVLLSRSS